jgi:hypothetical protein
VQVVLDHKENDENNPLRWFISADKREIQKLIEKVDEIMAILIKGTNSKKKLEMLPLMFEEIEAILKHNKRKQ